VDERGSLQALFERYESLPSRDEEGLKRALVDRIVVAVAARLAEGGDDERYRTLRDATARLRLLSAGAASFDEAVLDVIDAAREALGDAAIAEVVPVRPAVPEEAPTDDDVTRASEASFPASDPPGFVAGQDRPG
jgi:flavin-binding protein dodecin